MQSLLPQNIPTYNASVPKKLGNVFRWWSRSYLLDYLALAVALTITIVIWTLVRSRDRYVVPNDTTLKYPYDRHETVPTWLLSVLCTVPPLVYFLIWAAALRSLHDLHNAILGEAAAMLPTLLIVEVCKTVVGYHRPNYFGSLDASGGTNPTAAFNDTDKSFPSGHAALAFASYVFVVLYTIGKLGLLNLANRRRPAILGMLLACSWLILPFWIALSRINDYWHHPADVIAGALVGSATALVSYSLTFHPLRSARCAKPLDRADPDSALAFPRSFIEAPLPLIAI
eukprot:ANDGO_05315.mRNA.1 PA-phosphatase related-family protein DDB_G0284367